MICFWAKNFFTGNEQPTCEARNVLWHSFCLKTLQNISVETLVDHLPCWKIFIMQNTFYVEKSPYFEAWDSCLLQQGDGLLVLRTPCLFSCGVIVGYPWPLSIGNIVEKVCPPTRLPICQWLLWYISFFISCVRTLGTIFAHTNLQS